MKIDNNKPQKCIYTDTEQDVKGPPVLFSEFEAAFSEFKNKCKDRRLGCGTSRNVKSARCKRQKGAI